MKRIIIAAALAVLLLTGCAAKEALETVTDVYAPSGTAQLREIVLELPKGASVAALSAEETGSIYFCDGYTVTVQTLPGGDLDRTLRELTGYSEEKLKVMETAAGECTRYDFVWTCAGENGDQTCRGAVLSDGNYHYAVTTMTEGSRAGAMNQTLQKLFATFSLKEETNTDT